MTMGIWLVHDSSKRDAMKWVKVKWLNETRKGVC
jgi:hypothetical protein